MTTLSLYIDRCIQCNSIREYDYALIVHKVLHKHHIYTENGWILKKTKETNVPDKKGQLLLNDIKNVVVEEFIKRSKHWEKQADKTTDINLKNDYLKTASKIIGCADKLLKNEKFLNNVVKEARPLFVVTE